MVIFCRPTSVKKIFPLKKTKACKSHLRILRLAGFSHRGAVFEHPFDYALHYAAIIMHSALCADYTEFNQDHPVPAPFTPTMLNLRLCNLYKYVVQLMYIHFTIIGQIQFDI